VLDLLRHTANRVPAFIEGARAMTENLVSDWIGLLDGLPGDDLEQRFGANPDPEEVYRHLTDDMQAVLSGLPTSGRRQSSAERI
jgi:hypothetical protein